MYTREANGKCIKDGESDHLIDALRYAVVGFDGEVGKDVVERRY